jgi:hypothetical protein
MDERWLEDLAELAAYQATPRELLGRPEGRG